MAIQIRFDAANNPLPARLILATKSGNIIRELPIENVRFAEGLTDGSEFSFRVSKSRCVGSNGAVDEGFWEKIVSFKLAYCPEFDMWYELSVDISESSETVKEVQATSLGEAEIGQIKVYGIEVNTEEDIERDDYVPTVLYNQSNHDASLLHRLLYKAPHYRIAHVDSTIANIQRQFQFDNTSILDCFHTVQEEIDCLFKIECVKGSGNNRIDRKISVYDLENNCRMCGARGEFYGACDQCGSTSITYGYGRDTSIFVSTKNLAKEITYETDEDSVKNCFRLEAGDDLMTATVMNCNPNGSQYIWYLTDEMKADMSDALKNRLASYDTLYRNYQTTTSWTPDSTIRTNYNNLVTKYASFKPELGTIPSPVTGYPALMEAYYNTVDMQLFLESELMPNVSASSTTAQAEANKLNAGNIPSVAVANLSACTAATAANAVLAIAKCIVRASYQVTVNASSYNSSTHKWTGNFKVTNYSDEEDTATSASISVTVNDNVATYTKQKIRTAMNQDKDDITDVSELFDLSLANFKTELKKYSRQRLLAFKDCCQAAIGILIQQGAGDTTSSMYTSMYKPYYDKMSAVEAEIKTRTTEIETAVGRYDENGGLVSNGMQSLILARRKAVQNALNFETYLGTTLWNEFASFRREDSYVNQNYISDGLSNDEIFKLAIEFLDKAQRELYKSARLQHSIQASMNNLMSMREFRPLVQNFEVGNWIRVESDNRVYRLRLAKYEIDYSSWDLQVTFTDLREGYNSASDIQSILSMAKSMSTSYGAVTRQAKQGEDSRTILSNWVNEGLSLTTKIVGGAHNQEFIMDESGFTGREYIPETDGYTPSQVKIISDGVYYTNDNWLTVRAGLGKFTFWNPQTGQVEDGYGIIADKLVGNVVLSTEVGIYNESGSVQIDKNGFLMTTTSSGNTAVFTIRKKNANNTYSNILSINASGNLVLGGNGITGSLSGGLLTLGRIQDQAGRNYWDLVTGEFSLQGYPSADDLASAVDSAVSTYDTSLNQQKIFNKLTNNGVTQGIYLQNNKLYINASYIGTGTLSADRITANSLPVGKLSGTITAKGYSTDTASWGIDFTNGTLTIGNISADNIKAGTISVDRIGGHSVPVAKLKDTITAKGYSSETTASWGIDFTNGTMTIGNISAANIKTGTLSADRIGANSVPVGKLSGSITAKGYSSESSASWGIDFTNGTMTIGNISAANIKTGTLSADRISANSLPIGKLSGSITAKGYSSESSASWGIDFTNGTMTIGNISASSIKAGTLSADRIYGGTLTVGGSNNANGSISVKNASGTVLCTIDNNGLYINKGTFGSGSSSIKIEGSRLEFGDTSKPGGDGFLLTQSGIVYVGDNGSNTYKIDISPNDFYWYRADSTDVSFSNSKSIHIYHIGSELALSKNGSYVIRIGDNSATYPITFSKSVHAGKDMAVTGNFQVTGTKSRSVNTADYGDRLLYCYETPSPEFGDIGTGIIDENGTAYIFVDSVFGEAISSVAEYQVFLQKYGQGDCYVSERKAGYFVVTGTPGLSFGWELKAKQVDYDQLRLDRSDWVYISTQTDYGEMAAQFIEELEEERTQAE